MHWSNARIVHGYSIVPSSLGRLKTRDTFLFSLMWRLLSPAVEVIHKPSFLETDRRNAHSIPNLGGLFFAPPGRFMNHPYYGERTEGIPNSRVFVRSALTLPPVFTTHLRMDLRQPVRTIFLLADTMTHLPVFTTHQQMCVLRLIT